MPKTQTLWEMCFWRITQRNREHTFVLIRFLHWISHIKENKFILQSLSPLLHSTHNSIPPWSHHSFSSSTGRSYYPSAPQQIPCSSLPASTSRSSRSLDLEGTCRRHSDVQVNKSIRHSILRALHMIMYLDLGMCAIYIILMGLSYCAILGSWIILRNTLPSF